MARRASASRPAPGRHLLFVPAIRRTAELVQEAAAASLEQSAGVEQARAMAVVDQVTRRDASAMEELSSRTARMLAAGALQQQPAFFQRHRAPRQRR